MNRAFRILVVLAAIMGADGVILAALSAHLPDAARLGSASSILLFHATAVLGTVALAERGLIHVGSGLIHVGSGLIHAGIGLLAAYGFVVAAALFATDLTLRQFADHSLFPMAAPTGGTLLILSWLLLAVAAAWPRRG
jgi:uncharacterized membrane protein YgdD (TMEM256/DUF423 family)